MVKYHIATGDGKGYYGVGYESYRQAESLLKISQEHDPQAHIVEEEYHFTNADRIRAMSDELLASQLVVVIEETIKALTDLDVPDAILNEVRSQLLERLKQPAEGDVNNG